jgi:hypothetical protein
MLKNVLTGLNQKQVVACSLVAREFLILAYFKDINKNPYDNTVDSMAEGTGTPALGQSFLATAGKTYTLITNVGDADGGNVRKGPVVMTRE